MLRRWVALLICALLPLQSGCAVLLEREYAYRSPHSATPTTEGDSTVLRTESYQELVNALVYLVAQGTAAGTIRIYSTPEEAEESLEAACLEVVQEDPLGAYAVEYIQYDVSSLVTFCEATVDITYRRTREQVAGIVQATGVTAIRSALIAALDELAPERVLRIGYFDRDEAYILSLVQEAYYARPEAALGMPAVQVSIYPEAGRQRIVEILLTYPLPIEELQTRRQALIQYAQQIGQGLDDTVTEAALIQAIARHVLDACAYSPDGGSTAYDALFNHVSDSQGLSLAAALLYQQMGVGWELVQGHLDNRPHFWLVVNTAQGWRHLDLSQSDDPFALHLDTDLSRAGYQWQQEAVPSCT